jgi:hypothetical protein
MLLGLYTWLRLDFTWILTCDCKDYKLIELDKVGNSKTYTMSGKGQGSGQGSRDNVNNSKSKTVSKGTKQPPAKRPISGKQ